MHHSQDIKHVAWHPREEVAFISFGVRLELGLCLPLTE
jgi:hypothetical protein